MRTLIRTTFYLLTTLIPLVFTASTYELFEFPKFILLLTGTIIITVAWATHALSTHDWQLRAVDAPKYLKLLDYSVLTILITQTLATIFSLHPYTSFWGYYTRFHQGLLTTICYTILYFAAVKWMDKISTQKLINISIKTSIFVGVIAILEHYNISLTCLWMSSLAHFQNTANPLIGSTACWGALTNPLSRSFASLGQPNWLAAYLLPNLFLILYHSQNKQPLLSKIPHLLSFSVLFLALLFTNSRSGFIAFVLSFLTYYFVNLRSFSFRIIKNQFAPYASLAIATILLFGSPLTSAFSSYFKQVTPSAASPAVENVGTALESGGTASSEIRKIVWSGALRLIKDNPFLGTGPETFAYTYYWVRPVSHNYTSEWDYLYNKAHNEYLNLAATTGLIGLAAYLFWHYALLAASLIKIPRSKKVNPEDQDSLRAFLPVMAASLVSFGVTNFFGFSVIPVYFIMMIFISALPSSMTNVQREENPLPSNSLWLAAIVVVVLVVAFPGRLFLADYSYAKGKALSSTRPTEALPYLTRAVNLNPSEDLFHSTLSETLIALGQIEPALSHAKVTAIHNPHHLNYYKSRTKVYLALAEAEPAYYKLAAEELEAARKLSPTDPKLAYNLGLIYSRLGDLPATEKQMYQAIELKKNYPEPYYALTLIYEQTKNEAKVPALLQTARENLATYSGLLKEKIDKYQPE